MNSHPYFTTYRKYMQVFSQLFAGLGKHKKYNSLQRKNLSAPIRTLLLSGEKRHTSVIANRAAAVLKLCCSGKEAGMY